MVALMKYEMGLKFTELIFENKETAEKYLKETYGNKYGHYNPRAFKIIPVAYYTADGEVK